MGLSHTGLGLDPSLGSSDCAPWPLRELTHHVPQGRTDHQTPANPKVTTSALTQLPCSNATCRLIAVYVLQMCFEDMQYSHVDGKTVQA